MSTITSKTSWFSRLGDSFKGILVGLIIFIIAFPLLFWNEGRAVKRHKSLQEGADKVISVEIDKVDEDNEGELIHITGEATTKDTLSDTEFNVSVNAIKMKRIVEMYQWQENESSRTEKKLGGGTETVTEYTYEKVWSESLIDSSSFEESEKAAHQNPNSMQYESDEMSATNVSVGAFELSEGLISDINNYEAYSVKQTSNSASENDEIAQGTVAEATPLDNNADQSNFKEYNEGYYVGNDPSSPAIGDIKVRFEIVKPTTVSIVSEQKGNSFKPYKTEAGGKVELLEIGKVDAEEMFENAENANKTLTWILRVIGFFMMFIGLGMMLKPLSVLGDVVPFIGSFIGGVTSIIAAVIAFALSLITISIAWVFYRPIIGIPLLVVGIIGIYFGVKAAKGKKKTSASSENSSK